MSFYSPRFNPEQNKKRRRKKSAVFLTLPDDCNGGICWSYLGPLRPPRPSRQRHSPYHRGFCTTLEFIFVRLCPLQPFFCFFFPPCPSVSPQLPSYPTRAHTWQQTDRQTCGRSLQDFDLFESYSSCWHRLGESVGMILAEMKEWGGQRWLIGSRRTFCLCVCVCLLAIGWGSFKNMLISSARNWSEQLRRPGRYFSCHFFDWDLVCILMRTCSCVMFALQARTELPSVHYMCLITVVKAVGTFTKRASFATGDSVSWIHHCRPRAVGMLHLGRH